jgi:hypothetical protein
VTEQEWLACTDPDRVFKFVRGWANSRKLCLFCCACCRGIWDTMPDETSRRAVEVAERFAERLATEAEVTAALNAVRAVSFAARVATWAAEEGGEDEEDGLDVREADEEDEENGENEEDALDFEEATANAPDWAANPTARDAAQAAQITAGFAAAWAAGNTTGASSYTAAWVASTARAAGATGKSQCDILRCIFGNRLRPGPFLLATVLAWNDRLVVRLAQPIYDERRWEDMPLLADALLDAGCDNEEMLMHARERGAVHTRGCWLLDLLLNRE